MKSRTRLGIILAFTAALALYVFCVRMNESIRQTESDVRAKHETAAKLRAARGY